MTAQTISTRTSVLSDEVFERAVESTGRWIVLFYDSTAPVGLAARRSFLRLGAMGAGRSALVDAACCPRTARFFGLGTPPAMAVLDGRQILALGYELTTKGMEILLVEAREQRDRLIANDV